nr:hypothetical protein [Planctomycetota bacterium]
MRASAIIACLAALGAAAAEDRETDVVSTRDEIAPAVSEASMPESGPRERPHVGRLDVSEEFFLLYGIVGAGSERRFDGVLISRRDDGELVDGEAGLVCREVDHDGLMLNVRSITASVGTDRIWPREGRVQADASFVEERWRSRLPLYRVEVGAGYSQDRRLLLEADVIAGILHLGVARDDFVRTYRIGGAIQGRPDVAPVRLTIDRVLGYVAGERYWATEARLRVPWRLNSTLFVYGEGAHLRHGLENGRDRTAWEAFVGVG